MNCRRASNSTDEIQSHIPGTRGLPPLPGFDHTVDQSSKLLGVRFGGGLWSSPLQRQGLQFNPQRIELLDFFDIKGGYKSSLILDPAHESFMLKTDEGLRTAGVPTFICLAGNLLRSTITAPGFNTPEKKASFRAATTPSANETGSRCGNAALFLFFLIR